MTMNESDPILVRTGWRTYRRIKAGTPINVGDLVTTDAHAYGIIVHIRDNPPDSFVAVQWADDRTVTEHR